MRELQIVLSKSTYIAGETIQGYVLLKCDDAFECNRIPITLIGQIKTRITRSSGNSSTTYRETEDIINETQILFEGGMIFEGNTRYNFSFRLPELLPPSYRSRYAEIKYELRTKAEVSWALDPKAKKVVNIVMPYSNNPGKRAFGYCENNGSYVLEVEAEETAICIGQEIPLRIRVSRDVKIRGVRIELIHHELTRARRVKEHTKRIKYKDFIEDENLVFDTWFEYSIKTSRFIPPSFQTRLVTSYLTIKITLDIPWRFDKSAEIEIVCGFCIEPQEEPDLYGDF